MLRLLPDAERLTSAYLRAHPDLIALIGDRVFTALPGNPIYPLVALTRIGGVPVVEMHLDVARLQIDAWADTKGSARVVAATVQAAMHEMPGIHDLGVVTAVEDDLGLTWSPDPLTNKARYVAGYAVFSHP